MNSDEILKSCEEWADEEAYIAACEEVGPNDIEFDRVYEAKYEQYMAEALD